MLTRTFHLARIAGVEIRWHWSLPLLVLFPFITTPPRSLRSVVVGLLVALMFLCAVLLHELGHALMARWRGLPVRSVILWPYGGVALLGQQPSRARDELAVLAAGPAVNLTLAALLWLLGWRVWGPLPGPLGAETAGLPLRLLGATGRAALTINLILGGLNLLPIFPLDGGRIARVALRLALGPVWADRAMVALSIPLALAVLGYLVLARHWLDLPAGLLLLLGAAMLQPQLRGWIGMAYLRLADPASYFYSRNMLEQARQLVDRRIAANPQDARAHTLRGWIAFQRKEYRQMRAAFDRVVALQPEMREARFNRAYAIHLTGDNREALAELDPSESAALSIIGVIALDEQRLGDALTTFGALVALAPEEAIGSNNRGYVRLLLGDETGARADLACALALEPRLHHMYLNRAQLALRRGDYPTALADLDRAVQRNPWEVESYVLRALIYDAQGEPERAAAEVERAIAVHAEEALVHKEFWLRFWVVGRLAWAERYYEHAIALHPTLAAAHQGRGDALRVNGRLDEALAAYQQALVLEPGRASAYVSCARVRASLGDLAGAREEIERALALDPVPNVRQQAEALCAELESDVVVAAV